jgi:hypothetical protein
MTQKSQKIITAVLISLAVFGGFEALIYIVNLNQINIFLWTAFAIWLYLWIKISLLYDLHFKNPGSLKRAKIRHESVSHWLLKSLRVVFSAFWDRIEHFRKWKMFVSWANYLLLPGIIYWSTVVMLYLNLGRDIFQQIFVLLSGTALVFVYWHIKEIYTSKEEKVSLDSFIALSAIKIYTALAAYGAAIGYAKYNCDFISPLWFSVIVFCITFLLIYQALFQHKFTNTKNVFWTLLIALGQGILAYAVYFYWGYEHLTASIFLAAFYNMFWGVFHHTLEGTLSRRVFWETVIVSLFIAVLAVSVTNFKAQILPACF